MLPLRRIYPWPTLLHPKNLEYKTAWVALAEYLAEALAEMMHQKVRKEICGYAHSEIMVNMDLIDEKYQGIRPAPGYSACLYHTEKPTLFNC